MTSPSSASGPSGSRTSQTPTGGAADLPIRINTLDWPPATSLELAPTAVNSTVLSSTAPTVISIRIPNSEPRTFSYFFPENPAAAWLPPAKPRDEKSSTSQPTAPAAVEPSATDAAPPDSAAKKPITRIKPPHDIVKLQDRLYYALQPPLEQLLGGEDIPLPFEPFPYQYAGVGFLYPRYTAILADEMGLGKTMQAITAIRLLLRAGEVSQVLLVCPKPLVSNWRREFNLWAPEIPLGIIEGDQTRRHWQWRQPGTPVKIANYELLMRDRDILDEGLHFDLVVLDEAQRIKNRTSTTSEIARSISRSRSWALTGTPVENSPDDLVGIFEFLSPGYLTAGMQPRHMGQAVQEYILRRTKDMVLKDMPPRLFRDAELELSPEQFETYRTAEDAGILRLTEMGEGITIQHVFELVLRLKQICNFDPATGTSAKLERLEADMEEVVASGQKAIIFSQWVVTIERLRERLARFGTLEYHGQMPNRERETVIDQFRNDPKKHVILMSYGAGSVGLNLQFCRYVFLFDRWWNPAVEDQAINRAHRIGVAGPVTVTRMVTLGTIEERINQVLDEKRELFAAILNQPGSQRAGGLTQDEIFGLFNLKVQTKPRGQVA